MSQTIQYRCPCCGGALSFGSKSQELECASCGNTFPLEGIEEAAQVQVENTTDDQFDWKMPEYKGVSGEEAAHMRAYRCTACGAEILVDDTTAAGECVYCGNPTVMPDVLTGVYRPDGVIPFQKSKKDAQTAFANHCKGKKLLPDGFFDESRLEKITGVYVPFWLFACDAEADMTYNATRVSTHREGDYEVTRTAHFLVRRGGHVGFKGVPVDGSKKMDDALMESIEPFDSDLTKGFAVAYLSGYQAERHDVEAEACRPRANERVRRSVADLMSATTTGYTTCVPANTQIKLEHGRVGQVLMPVWLLNTRWRDQTFTFAMNGQTGAFIGDLPTDKGKFWKWLLGVFAGVSAGGLALLYLLTTLGGL
ncbi:MAG: hypothetical protein MR400_06710 [Clostridiales bacterium]|nr:hypothetical protein [Clostridiales bacterium]